MVRAVGPDLALPTVVRKMLESPENWGAVAKFAHAVMPQKEEAERERGGGQAPPQSFSGWGPA